MTQPSQESIEAAAQVWCRDECKKIIMDTTLAFAFAAVLDEQIEKRGKPCALLTHEQQSLLNFERDLQDIINRYSIENGSDTPDFLLARYLTDCLKAWNTGVKAREKWYGHGPKPCPVPIANNPNFQIGDPPGSISSLGGIGGTGKYMPSNIPSNSTK